MKLMAINGLKIVDAKRPLKVTITQRDVNAGKSKQPSSCAAARALLRQGCEQARVHVGRTYIKRGNKWVRFWTPRSLRDEIITFDRGGKFLPGTFTLLAVPPHEQEAIRKARPAGSHNVTGKRRRKPVMAGVRTLGANA